MPNLGRQHIHIRGPGGEMFLTYDAVALDMEGWRKAMNSYSGRSGGFPDRLDDFGRMLAFMLAAASQRSHQFADRIPGVKLSQLEAQLGPVVLQRGPNHWIEPSSGLRATLRFEKERNPDASQQADMLLGLMTARDARVFSEGFLQEMDRRCWGSRAPGSVGRMVSLYATNYMLFWVGPEALIKLSDLYPRLGRDASRSSPVEHQEAENGLRQFSVWLHQTLFARLLGHTPRSFDERPMPIVARHGAHPASVWATAVVATARRVIIETMVCLDAWREARHRGHPSEWESAINKADRHMCALGFVLGVLHRSLDSFNDSQVAHMQTIYGIMAGFIAPLAIAGLGPETIIASAGVAGGARLLSSAGLAYDVAENFLLPPVVGSETYLLEHGFMSAFLVSPTVFRQIDAKRTALARYAYGLRDVIIAASVLPEGIGTSGLIPADPSARAPHISPDRQQPIDVHLTRLLDAFNAGYDHALSPSPTNS